jgi:hypothetical protein
MTSRGLSSKPYGEPVDTRSALREGISYTVLYVLMMFVSSKLLQIPAEALLLPTVGAGLFLGVIAFGLARTVRGAMTYRAAIMAASFVVTFITLVMAPV